MHARSLWATYGRQTPALLGRSRRDVARRIAYYASAYAWRHYGKSSVQRGLLSVLGWPRWVYKRAKHAVLLSVYGALVTSRRLGVTGFVQRGELAVLGWPRWTYKRLKHAILVAIDHVLVAARRVIHGRIPLV